MAEQEVIKANGQGGLITTSLRPHAIWGPRDAIGFFPQLLYKITSGKIKKFSGLDKDIFLDMCYVQNIADACTAAAESDNVGGKVYFITDGDTVNAWEYFDTVCDTFNIPRVEDTVPVTLAKVIAEIIGFIWKIPYLARTKRPPITPYAVGMMTHSATYSIEAARKDFNYNPKVSVEKGLGNLKGWIDEIGGLDKFYKHVK